MKAKADNAVDQTPSIEKVIVVKRTGAEVIFKNSRDLWWHELVKDKSSECKAEVMEIED